MQVYFFVSGSMDYVLKPFEINVPFASNPYKCLLFSANVFMYLCPITERKHRKAAQNIMQ